MFTARSCLHFHRQTWKAWIVASRSVPSQVFPISNNWRFALRSRSSNNNFRLRSQSRRAYLTRSKFKVEGECTGTNSLTGDASRWGAAFFTDAAASGVRQVIPTAKVWPQVLPRPRSMAGASIPPAQAEIISGRALQFWEGSQREAYCALYHPFVVALASGVLESGVYKSYIAQDYYFLQAFAEAYRLAIDNTDDADARRILTELKAHIQDELDEVHLSSTGTESQGLEVTEAEPNAATTAYTDFLLEVAKGKLDFNDGIADLKPRSAGRSEECSMSRQVAAYTIAAMTPCNRLYAFLGQEIMNSVRHDTSCHPYAQWIEMYTSEGFASTAVQCENLLDRLGMQLSDPKGEEIMRRLYRRSMNLEVAFFDKQMPPFSSDPLLVPVCRSLASKLHFVFVSDFDCTCTVSDSCPALADLSLSTSEQMQLSTRSLKSRWDALIDEYTQGYGSLMPKLLEPEAGSDYNPELVRRILEELSEFEIAANDRVVNAGVLAGLNATDVKRKGGEMPLREGCKQLLERLSESDVHILSVCWSRTFVDGAFLENGLGTSNIRCNELQFDAEGISTGGVLRQIQTPVDKHRKFLNILEKSGDGLTSTFSVYAGDSATDLLCLLTADVGVVISPSKSLARVAKACGITILPLYAGLLDQQRRKNPTPGTQKEQQGSGSWTKEDGVLYEISSWHELHAFLLGI